MFYRRSIYAVDTLLISRPWCVYGKSAWLMAHNQILPCSHIQQDAKNPIILILTTIQMRNIENYTETLELWFSKGLHSNLPSDCWDRHSGALDVEKAY